MTALICATPVAAQSPRQSVDVNGVRRWYLLHLPPVREPSRPVPLLFVFHAASGDAAGIASHTGLTRAAGERGCVGEITIGTEPDAATDGTRVRRTTFGSCQAGRDVVLFTIEGGGHTWPGGHPVGRSVGRVSRDLQATRVMLDFFDRHPNPEPERR